MQTTSIPKLLEKMVENSEATPLVNCQHQVRKINRLNSMERAIEKVCTVLIDGFETVTGLGLWDYMMNGLDTDLDRLEELAQTHSRVNKNQLETV